MPFSLLLCWGRLPLAVVVATHHRPRFNPPPHRKTTHATHPAQARFTARFRQPARCRTNPAHSGLYRETCRRRVAGRIAKAIQYTNQLRAEKGLPALKYDAKLAAYAQQRAEEVVGRFAHTRPDGNESFHDKVLKQGRMGENLAAGANSAQQTVMEQWKTVQGIMPISSDPNSAKLAWVWCMFQAANTVIIGYKFSVPTTLKLPITPLTTAQPPNKIAYQT